LDFGNAYQRWSSVIDFALFFTLFAGAAKATVGRRLEGRGGELVSLALGGMLALGAVGLEAMLGINLAALGPLASVVLLVLVGGSLVLLLRGLGVHTDTSIALSVVVVALGGTSISPRVPDSLGWAFSLLQLAALGGVGYLAWKLFGGKGGLHGSDGRLKELAKEIRAGKEEGAASEEKAENEEIRQDLKKERRAVSRILRPVARQEVKTSDRLVREMKLVQRALQHGSLDDSDRSLISAALARIPPRRHELRDMVTKLHDLDQRLIRFDAGLFTHLRERWDSMSPAQREAFKRTLLEERQKIGIEQRIDYIDRFVATYDANSGRCLEKAGELVVAGDIVGARNWVAAAIRYEEEAEKMAERVRAVARMLNRITKQEAREVGRAPPLPRTARPVPAQVGLR